MLDNWVVLVNVTCFLFDTSLARELCVFSSVTTAVGSSLEYLKVIMSSSKLSSNGISPHTSKLHLFSIGWEFGACIYVLAR